QRVDLGACSAPELGALYRDQARYDRAHQVNIPGWAAVRHRLRPDRHRKRRDRDDRADDVGRHASERYDRGRAENRCRAGRAGTDDRDEMGIAVEPPEQVIGLTEFEQHIHRTAEERLKHNPSSDQRWHGRTPPSQAGDLDLTVYSLRKYTRLAANGNPTVQILLFVKPSFM